MPTNLRYPAPIRCWAGGSSHSWTRAGVIEAKEAGAWFRVGEGYHDFAPGVTGDETKPEDTQNV